MPGESPNGVDDNRAGDPPAQAVVPPTRAPEVRLDGRRALDVLAELDAQLGAIDPDVRALVALRPTAAGGVELVELTQGDDGVLDPPADIAGIVVVTSEDVHLDEGGAEVTIRQLAAILRGGDEVGVVRLGDDPTPRAWSSADAEALRPRDVTANAARRALGLPSLADVPPIEDLLARAWLLRVAEEALSRFDAPGGPREVAATELTGLADIDPLDDLDTGSDGSGPGRQDPSAPLTWVRVREAAVAGRLRIGSFTVEPGHARWLDVTGFAQVVDRTLPSTGQLLGTLHVVGEDPLVDWAVSQLAARGWGAPR